jgi:hypothetical protein
MPKLLAYLPCEKVVIEDQSKNVSVLSILETVTVTMPQGAAAPAPNASIRMPWDIRALAKLSFGANARQQVVNRMADFPVWTPGACHLRLMVKTARDTDFRQLASVIIMLRHSWN